MKRKFERALIIGGSRGTGRAMAKLFTQQAIHTTVVARHQEGLQDLQSELPDVKVIAMDAASDGAAQSLIWNVAPDLLCIVGGHAPKIGAFHQQDWNTFSEAWNTDAKISHSFLSAALTMPMAKGGAIVNFSSGAGLSGSRLTGGYAGAKRMQHFLAQYAQREADLLGLDLSIYSIIPKQLIEGSKIGEAAAAAYSEATGKTIAAFKNQWDHLLTPEMIADEVLGLVTDQDSSKSKTFTLTGSGRTAV